MRAIDADALKERIMRFLGIKSIDNLLPAEKAIVQHIDRMPTIQIEQRWIPCSERLPEEDGIYRVTIDPDYLTPDMVPTEDLYWHEGKWKYCDLVHHPNRMPELKLFELEATVLAWKPLEEPYKEQRG